MKMKRKYSRLMKVQTLFLCTLLTNSCAPDDFDKGFNSGNIKFITVIQDSWSELPVSKSSDDYIGKKGSSNILSFNKVYQLKGDSEKSFYLHVAETNSITETVLDKQAERSQIETRATPIVTGNMYNSFGVSAYVYAGSWDGSQAPNYMYNIPFAKSGAAWVPNSAYYWPGSGYNIRFFAYAPHNAANVTLSSPTSTGMPSITYTVPPSAENQNDLLVASSGEQSGNHNSDFPLTFYHALTAIRFVTGADVRGGTVKSVSLRDISNKGVFSFATNTWTIEAGSKATFTQNLNKSVTGTTGEDITTAAQTFMMLPQTLPSGSKLEVVFNDGAQDHTLTADIGGSIWDKGKTITYQISTSSINWEYYLMITPPATYSYAGGTNKYSVASYKQKKGTGPTAGTSEAIPWSAEYSTDGGSNWTTVKPSWLTSFTGSDVGSTTVTNYDATVAVQSAVTTSQNTQSLRIATKKNDFDLSTINVATGATVTRTTANCYVIKAPGTYKFPVVYGNGVKNNLTNSSAYTTSSIASNLLSRFLDHNGTGITDPYISRQHPVTDACLLWQDAPGLISNIGIVGTGNDTYVTFSVDENTIQEGNAIIAVRGPTKDILWSWHIWVTNQDLTALRTISNTTTAGVTYSGTFMPVNVGWCNGIVNSYNERKCMVRISQTGTNLPPQTMTITQTSSVITNSGNSPYYQWGRKDPMLPALAGKIDKAFFVNNSNYAYGNQDLSTSVSAYIKNPHKFNIASGGGMDGKYLNLWNSNNSAIDDFNMNVVKTIYDPCPVGFKMPNITNFRGTTTTGENANNPNIRGTWSTLNNDVGWLFDASPTKTHFQAIGLRWYTTGLSDLIKINGYYWSAVPAGATTSYRLSFGNNDVFFKTTSQRGFGEAVRGVME